MRSSVHRLTTSRPRGLRAWRGHAPRGRRWHTDDLRSLRFVQILGLSSEAEPGQPAGLRRLAPWLWGGPRNPYLPARGTRSRP